MQFPEGYYYPNGLIGLKSRRLNPPAFFISFFDEKMLGRIYLIRGIEHYSVEDAENQCQYDKEFEDKELQNIDPNKLFYYGNDHIEVVQFFSVPDTNQKGGY